MNDGNNFLHICSLFTGSKIIHGKAGCLNCETKTDCKNKENSTICACMYHDEERLLEKYKVELKVYKNALATNDFPRKDVSIEIV